MRVQRDNQWGTVQVRLALRAREKGGLRGRGTDGNLAGL